MSLTRHRAFRLLAGVCCSLGLLGVAEGTPATWTLLALAVLLAAAMPALFSGPSLVPAKMPPHVEVTR